MKKLLSVLLCAVMLAGTVLAAVPGAAQVSDYNKLTEAPADLAGAVGSYDSYLDAAKIEIAAGGSAAFTISGTGSEDTYLIAMLPAAYGAGSVGITVGETSAALTASHKFTAVSVGSADSISVSIAAGSADVAVYLYGTAGESRRDEMLAAANGSLNKYDEEYLDLDTYDVARYTKYFWEGDLVFNESFYPIEESDGSIKPITLNYPVDKVVSVRNSYLDTEYVYGKDYKIEDGKLILTPDTAVNVYKYTDVYGNTQKNSSWRKMLNGGYAYCGQHSMFFYGYCNITYTTTGTWNGTVPEQKGFLLSNALSKLETKGQNVKLLSIGDSLAGGANASADLGAKPYAEVWCDMIASGLRLRYPDANIETSTIAQGGADASLCITKMDDIIAYAPDLLFIEFGTNECMQGDSPTAEGNYIDTLKQAIAAVNEALPECDIVIVAPPITNPVFFPSNWFYAYADSLYSIEREGVAIADVTSVYQYMLTNKRYIDMSGDYLCHPSDFGSRVIVQTLLRTLETGSEQDYINGLSNRILRYRYKNEYYDKQWQELCAMAQTGSEAIAACTGASAACSEYAAQIKKLSAVKTISDILAETEIDASSLIFNIPKTLDLVSESINNNYKYDADEPALVATATLIRSPRLIFDYTKAETAANAEDYSYAVVTLKHPMSNRTADSSFLMTFSVNGNSVEARSAAMSRSDSYVSYIVDLTGIDGWSGRITELDMTLFQPIKGRDTMYISSVMLCADMTEARDVAIERARIANKLSDGVVTKLIADESDAALLKTDDARTLLLGDADGDGALNARDMLYLRRYVADVPVGIGIDTLAADMDGDSEITAADCLLLRKTLAGVIDEENKTLTPPSVSFSDEKQAAAIAVGSGTAAVTVDMSDEGVSADSFRYVSLCAATASGKAMNVTVTVTTENGSYTDTLTIAESDKFTADTARFADAAGNITSVRFTFDVSEGETVYFDSFVLSPTITAARNAETVRIGAANLI